MTAKNIVTWLLIFCLGLLSCSNNQQLFQEFVKSIEFEKLGKNDPELKIYKIGKELYKIDIKVIISEEITQKGWAITIIPGFEGAFH